MSPEPELPSVKSYLKSTYTKWARMGYWLLALLTFNLSLLTIQSCGLDVEDPTPPSPPVWVQKSLPEEWPEQGIDAHESGGIFLEWEHNPEENITAYLIYRSEYDDANENYEGYEKIARIEAESILRLEYLDEEVSLGKNYSYKLKAEDYSQNISGFSDSIGYTLLPPILSIRMSPNGITQVLDPTKELSWDYILNIEMENYCVTILTSSSELVWREILSPGNYIGGIESWHIPADVILAHGRTYIWRIDTMAKYINDLETAGSESPWASFLYLGD
jgi:hypothetical protein